MRAPQTIMQVYPDDEDEEPWDQRRPTQQQQQQQSYLEDGDLPSLTPRSPIRQTIRGDLEQRKFWGQLDDALESSDEEMPHDELITSRNSKHRELRNTPRQSDEQYEADSYDTEEERMLDSGFCDSTLNVLGDMCGAYTGHKITTYSNKRITLRPRDQSDVQEEHTAIEVEFVDDETEPARHHRDMSAEAKNAYLSAMAAQAKEEFRSKKGKDDEMQTRSSSIVPSIDDAGAYDTFNAAEKRKFIRLINTGANPREATQMILQERSTLKPEPPRLASDSVVPKRSLSENKRSHRSHRSAVLFWKKSKYNQQKRSASAEPLRPTHSEEAASDLQSLGPKSVNELQTPSPKNKTAPLTDDEDETGERFAKSGIHYYDAERKEDDPDEVVPEASNTSTSIRSTRSEQLRKVGFKSLAERRSKSAARITQKEEDVQRPGQSSTGEAAVRSSPDDDDMTGPMPMEDDNDSMTDMDHILNTAEDPVSFHTGSSDPDVTVDDALAEKHNVGDSNTSDQVPKDDRNAELYLNARNQYGALSIPASDESVFTTQTTDTGYTGVTGVTTYSHSSRVRRPGAAKKRLAKEKQLKNKAKASQGWVQSIQQVAATTNQKWDPFLGWVDYLEPVVELPEKVSRENIHLDLTKKILTPSKRSEMDDTGSVSTAKSTPVPFPREWEEERAKMLQEAENERRKLERLAEDENPSELANHVQLVKPQDMSRDGIPKDGSRPNGWLESMKAASATLAKDGKQWDPEKGWINPDGTPIAVSTSGDFMGLPPPPPPLAPLASRTYQARQIEKPDSPVIMDRIGAAPIVQPDRYVQIGDTGSVRSVTQQLSVHATSVNTVDEQLLKQSSVYESTYVSDDDTDVDSAPLPNGAGKFPPGEEKVSAPSANVNVVREKISNEDMGLFASGNDKKIGHTGRTESLGSEGLPDLFGSRQHDNQTDWNPDFEDGEREPSRSQDPLQKSAYNEVDMGGIDDAIEKKIVESKRVESVGRRGHGPVDLDELDETEAHEIRSAISTGSDARSSLSINTDAKSIASFKLRSSVRDTSPLTRRRSAEKYVVTPSPVQEAGRAVLKDRNIPMGADRQIKAVASHESYDQEMVDHHQTLTTTIAREEPVRVVSPGVRNTVAEWESRAAKKDGAPSSPTNSAEWKAFLGKKVRAEREAASGSKLDSDGRLEKVSSNTPRQLFKPNHDEVEAQDDDSLFDFKSAVNATSDYGTPPNAVHAPAKPTIALVTPDTKPTPKFTTNRESIQTSNNVMKSEAVPMEEISHLSPINSRDEEDDDQEADVDRRGNIPALKAYGPETGKRVNFFQRMAECAGPVMPQNKGIPSSHLSFLQNNICGRPDDVHDDDATADDGILDDDIEKLEKGAVMGDDPNLSIDDQKDEDDIQRKTDRRLDAKLSRSKLGFSSNRSSAGSSVISDENFGAKTAYLEAIAMKAAVARPKSRSRARSSSNASVVSSASSAHSEKWKAFLERKKAAGGTTPSVVSRASEKYAEEKYKEMLAKLKAPSRQPEADDMSQSAKDLSGAKVEALMAQLTGSNVNEGEI